VDENDVSLIRLLEIDSRVVKWLCIAKLDLAQSATVKQFATVRFFHMCFSSCIQDGYLYVLTNQVFKTALTQPLGSWQDARVVGVNI
jgi:hypothetical protein